MEGHLSSRGRLLRFAFCLTFFLLVVPSVSQNTSKYPNVKHVLFLIFENWSYDGLFGSIGNGIQNASNESKLQLDLNNNPYSVLPLPVNPGSRMPEGIPNGPFDISEWIPTNTTTIDLIHAFPNQQLQINGGKMNKFAAYGNAKGLTMSHYDLSSSYLGQLALNYTVFDHWFHAGFGGSWFNHQWLVTENVPYWPEAPAYMKMKGDPLANDTFVIPDAGTYPAVTHDGYVVNTIYPNSHPRPAATPLTDLLPLQTAFNIGDQLMENNITWNWYAGGYDNAMAGKPDQEFQYHHLPLSYFKNFDVGTPGRAHLKDYNDLIADIKSGQLPRVSYYKPLGEYNMHPQYSTPQSESERMLKELVELLQSKEEIWSQLALFILFDENGGRWDHVTPPVHDRWGPGVRIPAVLVSPLAKKKFIDSTVRDSTSVMKFITDLCGLESKTDRAKAQPDFLNAFETSSPAPPQTDDSKGLSTGAIVGIIVACVVGALILVGLGFLYLKGGKGGRHSVLQESILPDNPTTV